MVAVVELDHGIGAVAVLAAHRAVVGAGPALRRNALGFRNMINYRIRSLLHCGNFAL